MFGTVSQQRDRLRDYPVSPGRAGGEDFLWGIGSEFIENNGADRKRQENMSVEEIKQDCETKAFLRLAGRIKKRFPRLPILLLADSLYASSTNCAGNTSGNF